MRPGEIDFSKRTKPHFFDVTNGEVLAGVRERDAYIRNGADPDMVRHIGALLRGNEDAWAGAQPDQFDPVGYSTWTPDKYREYGYWIKFMIEAPTKTLQRPISGGILSNAYRLGIGASPTKIKKEYGNLSNYYVTIGVADAHIVKRFHDWSLKEVAAYVKKIGGGSIPTIDQLNRASKSSVNRPSYNVINSRHQDGGVLGQVAELEGHKGHLVTRRWTREDFVDWGVRFMEANDGLLPTTPMIYYLCRIKRGPSLPSIRRRFRIPDFHSEIRRQYDSEKKQRTRLEADMISDMRYRLRQKTLPEELFAKPDPNSEESDLRPLQERLADPHETEELITLYARYMIAERTRLKSSAATIANVCVNAATPKEFIQECKDETDADDTEIEEIATELGVFDLIWPMKDHMEALKIDKTFEDYLADKRKKDAARQARYKAQKTKKAKAA